MFNILKELLFSRELSFEEGTITMLKGRVVIIPIHIFVEIYKKLQEYKIDPNKFLYEIGEKEGVYWIGQIKDRYRMKPAETLKWGLNSMSVGGWGKIETVKVDLIKKDIAVFRAYNSPFAKLLGRTGKVSDPILAGFIGGGGSIIYNRSLECQETKCIAKGDMFCEFVVRPSKKDWLSKYRSKYQLKGNEK
jgi:predicted hydrocarbon binding protein